ncbi:MAG: Rne/Rng family ribonuclease [Acidobacteriota bacterium]|nr:Rne/Rng family ribonuclease [Acidobacteriota bacterium]
MPKEMVISANPHETRVAILEEGQLCEYYVEREKEFALVGSIYKGRVTRVLPGMQSAFVDIGLDSDAFLYVSDFLEGVEEFEPIVATVEDKTKKMQEEGGQVFPTNGGVAPVAEPPDVEALPSESLAAHATATPAGLEGEEFQPGNTWTAPPAPAASSQHPGSQDRGRFEGGHRQGRDFGRRGRGGRFGRRGRGDRHFGRELPPSKYASHAAREESGPAEPYVPVILPGESLARYRDPGAVAANAPTEEIAPNVPPDEPPAIPESPLSEAAGPNQPARDESVASESGLELRFGSYEAAGPQDQRPERDERPERPERYGRPRHERYQRPERPDRFERPRRPDRFERAEQPASEPSGSSGLEPLPGENIAKSRSTASAQPAPAAEPTREEFGGTAEREIEQREETQLAREEFGGSAEAHPAHEAHEELDENAAPDLSPEEAAAIAEHVAEAQSEQAEREQLRTDIAAPGDAAEIEAHEEASHSEMDAANEENGYDLEGDETASEETEEESDAAAEEIAAAQAEIEHEAASGLPEMEPLSADAGTEHIGDEPAQPEPERQPFAARVRDDFRPRMQHPARRGRDRDRGRRPHHRHYGHHRPQNRRPQLIADLLKQGQEIIVQIAKEPLGKKGARITSHVALPGRYLVYMPTLDHSGVSRKIASAEERSRLRHLVNDAKGTAPGGFIVRTAAAAAAPEEVRADVEFLTHTWSEIKSRSEQRKAPSLLHRDLNLVERILRDHMNSDYTAIWVDNEEAYLKVTEFISRFQSSLANRVKLYSKETPIFEEFGIQQEIEKGLRPKVWLKSGGYIVINHTEALVAIDVNTGKFVGKGSTRLEDTIVRTNLEAAKEIVRQMRLRDLGGIIVIDFIDMEDRRNREKVMSALEDALRSDRAPSKMLRFNEFGLIAITRKRTKQALERTLCQPCPYCTGSGMVKSVPTLCYEIQTEARKMAPDIDSGSITLRVHPEIAKALKTRESSLIEELETWTKKSAIIQADPTLHWEQYDIY